MDIDNDTSNKRKRIYSVIFFFNKNQTLAPSKIENKCAEKEERRKGGGRKYHDERNIEFTESRHVTIVKSCFGGSLAFRVRILEKAQVQCEEEGGCFFTWIRRRRHNSSQLSREACSPPPLLFLSLSPPNSRSLEESAHVTLIMHEGPPRRNV